MDMLNKDMEMEEGLKPCDAAAGKIETLRQERNIQPLFLVFLLA
jgi:hypothetical protein